MFLHDVFLRFDFGQDQLLAIVAGLQEGIEDLLAGRVFHPKEEVPTLQLFKGTDGTASQGSPQSLRIYSMWKMYEDYEDD